jgi:uncharacterized protein YkwD
MRTLKDLLPMKSLILIGLLLVLQGSNIIQNRTETEIASKPVVCLSAEEKKLYDIIMQYRKSKGLPAIPISAKLTQVAQVHAKDLVVNYRFDVNNKCNPHSWSKKGKWSACCYTSDHKEAQCMWDKPKEIAGYNSPGYEIAYYSSRGATAEEGLVGWQKSPAHNPLLINEGMWSKVQWKALGIGIYKQYGIVWFGEAGDSTDIGDCSAN